MANALTGTSDAVVQIRVEAINRILATLHQNGVSKDANDAADAGPTFLHSFALRASEPAASHQFAKQVAEHAVAAVSGGWAGTESGGSAAMDAGTAAPPSKAPSGIANLVEHARAELATGALAEAAISLAAKPDAGTARVQVGTPMITFPDGSTSEVTVRLPIRAHHTPDPGTNALPEPIHGEVRASFSVHVLRVADASSQGKDPEELETLGKRVLKVALPTDDSQIEFLDSAGLLAPDAQKIEEHIRFELRNKFEPMTVPLPEGFAFLHFKALGGSSIPAIALPFNLSASGGAEPSPAAASYSGPVFLKPGDSFAIAISREHIEPLLGGTQAGLQQQIQQFTIAPYAVNGSVELKWQDNRIKLLATVNATTDTPLPNFTAIINQDLHLALDTAAQKVVITKGDLHVGVSSSSLIGELFEDFAKDVVTQAFNALLDKELTETAQPKLDQALSGTRFDTAVNAAFHAGASSTYTSLETELQDQGVILHGMLTVKARPPVVVDFTETADGTGFTAFRSWVPAGWAGRYVWSWSESGSDPTPYPWTGNGAYNPNAHEHRFIVPKPKDLAKSFSTRVCLRVEGVQLPSAGHLPGQQVSDSSCQMYWRDLLGDIGWWKGPLDTFTTVADLAGTSAGAMPAWWQTAMAVPIWLPDPPPDAALDAAIVAHVSPIGHTRRSAAPGVNSVIHFADAKSAKPLDTLGRALARSKRRDAPVAIILVLPRGSFQNRRSSVEEKLGSLARDVSASLSTTEDYEGGWTRTFGVERTPATYLMNARGELVWQHLGSLDAAALAAALDQHLISGARPKPRLLRLAVQPGDRALDFLFEYAHGERIALRRLRGERVLLTFWQSWSAPCLAELRRLQSLHARGDRRGPVILAVNDGEDPQRLDEVRRAHDLTLTLVPDPHRRIARRYGVTCWPTTISISENGLVDGVQFGVTPDRSAASARAPTIE